MQIKTGKAEVWQHAKECGLDEAIALIAKYFEIKDVSIIGNGKLTYIDERPRKMVRVPALPAKVDYKNIVAETKAAKKYYK